MQYSATYCMCNIYNYIYALNSWWNDVKIRFRSYYFVNFMFSSIDSLSLAALMHISCLDTVTFLFEFLFFLLSSHLLSLSPFDNFKFLFSLFLLLSFRLLFPSLFNNLTSLFIFPLAILSVYFLPAFPMSIFLLSHPFLSHPVVWQRSSACLFDGRHSPVFCQISSCHAMYFAALITLCALH